MKRKKYVYELYGSAENGGEGGERIRRRRIPPAGRSRTLRIPSAFTEEYARFKNLRTPGLELVTSYWTYVTYDESGPCVLLAVTRGNTQTFKCRV